MMPRSMHRGALLGILVIGACAGDAGGPTGPENPRQPQLTTIVVTSADSRSTLMLGETLQLSATGRDQSGQPVTVPSFGWSSSDATVATVDANGRVTAAGGGQAKITATAQDKAGSFDVTVAGSLHTSHVTADQTWRVRDNPHIVRGSIRVAGAGAPTLTLEPGVEVRFGQGSTLTIGGSGGGVLRAAGTAAAPIRLVAESGTPAPGFWEGLWFEGGSAASELRNLTLSHCGSGGTPACIYLNDVRILIENLTIQNSGGYGVVAQLSGGFASGSSALRVTGAARAPVRIWANSAGTIPPGSVLTGNSENYIDIIDENVITTQSWGNHDVPYHFSRSVRVGGGTGTTVLTIAAGTELRFAPEAMFWADGGQIQAVGSAQAPIRFTAAAAAPTAGVWDGVHMWGTAATGSRFVNVVFEYCGRLSGPTPACLMVNNASVLLEDVTVRHSAGNGIHMAATAEFTTGSRNVSVSNAARHPIRIVGGRAGTLPRGGTYTDNADNTILLESDGYRFVEATQTWANHGIPYVVGDLFELDGTGNPTLTIEPGTTLRFGPDVAFWVDNGVLKAEGTATAPIRFTAHAADPQPGHWGYIEFQRASAASRITHAIIEYGGGDSSYMGMVYLWKEMGAFITSTTLRNSLRCGIGVSHEVTTNFTADALGNTFTGNGAAAVCQR